MPAPVLKFITAFKLDLGFGWTEVHYKQAESESPNLNIALNNFANDICSLRAGLLGESASIQKIRVSYPRAGVLASLPRKLILAGSLNQPTSNSSSSLAVGFADGSFTKTKTIHLRGFWDSVEANGGYQPTLGETWQDRLDLWKNALTSKAYGWLSKDPATSSTGNVVSYDTGATGIVSFILAAPGINAAYVGTRQQIRFSKFHASRSPLNRSLLCQVIDATHVQTTQPIGCDPVSSTGRFNHRAVSFVAYNTLTGISVGERRMGAPLDRYPGRLPAKARW